MKSYSVTIQMKATEQYFLVVLFNTLLKGHFLGFHDYGEACLKLNLLSLNWKNPSPKVIEAKEYELNRQNNV